MLGAVQCIPHGTHIFVCVKWQNERLERVTDTYDQLHDLFLILRLPPRLCQLSYSCRTTVLLLILLGDHLFRLILCLLLCIIARCYSYIRYIDEKLLLLLLFLHRPNNMQP